MKNASEMRALMWDYHTPNFYKRIAEIEKQMEETAKQLENSIFIVVDDLEYTELIDFLKENDYKIATLEVTYDSKRNVNNYLIKVSW